MKNLTLHRNTFIEHKESILHQWIEYEAPKRILKLHAIDKLFFIQNYAGAIFDYFMDVISQKIEFKNSSVMQELLMYLKEREISANELFEICSNFKHAILDFSYDKGINTKDLFNEVLYIFDGNFKEILRFYTDTIFSKLVIAKQEAINASQAKEYFLSNMSHEIRTPLNAILGFVNLLLDDEISRKHRNYLDIIHNSGENLLTIINDILDFSKLRSGEFTLEVKSFSAHEEISHTMELFVASANAKDITIISFIDPEIPKELLGDALRIKQILSNFLSNAIKFTPVNGVIKVEAYYVNSSLKIDVKDNGIGISPDEIDKIFLAFAQAQNSTSIHEGGTGLGLSICNQLAKKMQGRVSVESEVGKGSTFTLNVPLESLNANSFEFIDMKEFQDLKIVFYAQDKKITYKHNSFLKYAKFFNKNIQIVDTFNDAFDVGVFIDDECDNKLLNSIKITDKKYIAITNKEYDTYDNYKNIVPLCFPLYCAKIYKTFDELLNHANSSKFKLKIFNQYKGHILVAEDNEANQELIKIVLTKFGLSFDITNNGLEALNLFKIKKYDLVLMDEQMPVMNGNEAVIKIREYEKSFKLKSIPITAVTANVIKGAKERDLVSGFDAFLGKPIVLKELEKIFLKYLKVNDVKEKESISHFEKIVGLDTKKLQKDLLLEYSELLMLLKLYKKKMQTLLIELKQAIDEKDYKNIALLSHSIKGSSGNFRIKLVQDTASQMEKMAKEKNSNFDYISSFDVIDLKLKSIRIE